MIKTYEKVTYKLEQKDIEVLRAMKKYCLSCDDCNECVLNEESNSCHFIDVTDDLEKNRHINYEDEIKVKE